MPISGVDSQARSAMTAKVRGVGWLIEMEFLAADLVTPAPIYMATWPLTDTIDGKQYRGVGNLVQVSALNESENPTAERLTISASVVDASMKALALGGVERYRNRRVRLYLQMYDETYRPKGAKVLRWAGYMDRVKIPRARGSDSDRAGSPSRGRIEMECSRAGADRSRRAEGWRLTANQLKLDYPGDLGLDYMHELIENPTLWLSKKFQEV